MDWHTWWPIPAGVPGGFLLLWVGLIAALWFTRPDHFQVREALRLLPDLIRLLQRLAGDPSLPRGVRIQLWLLLGCLAMPFDLVPNCIPVLATPMTPWW